MLNQEATDEKNRIRKRKTDEKKITRNKKAYDNTRKKVNRQTTMKKC